MPRHLKQYQKTGVKLALMNGQTVTKAFIPLPAGAAAVYTSGWSSYRSYVFDERGTVLLNQWPRIRLVA